MSYKHVGENLGVVAAPKQEAAARVFSAQFGISPPTGGNGRVRARNCLQRHCHRGSLVLK
jgi:hypothetical protein